MHYVFEYSGKHLTIQKITPGDTITSLNPEMYVYTERYVAFTSGSNKAAGTPGLQVGDWTIGATSAAKAEVIAVSVSTGAFADGDAAGTIKVRCQHGTFQNENLNVGADGNMATIATDTDLLQRDSYVNPEFYGKYARYAIVMVTGATALCLWNGSKPNQTALVGAPLPAVSSTTLNDTDSIRNFKCIDYTSQSASTLTVLYYF